MSEWVVNLAQGASICVLLTQAVSYANNVHEGCFVCVVCSPSIASDTFPLSLASSAMLSPPFKQIYL